MTLLDETALSATERAHLIGLTLLVGSLEFVGPFEEKGWKLAGHNRLHRLHRLVALADDHRARASHHITPIRRAAGGWAAAVRPRRLSSLSQVRLSARSAATAR